MAILQTLQHSKNNVLLSILISCLMHLHSLAAHPLSLHMQQLLNIFYRKNRKLIQSSGIDWKRDWWFRTVSFSFTTFYWWCHICKCSGNTCLYNESCPEEISLSPHTSFFFFFMLEKKKMKQCWNLNPINSHQRPYLSLGGHFSYPLSSFFSLDFFNIWFIILC